MKKTIIIFALIVSTLVIASGQTTRGSLAFGGGFSYTVNKDSYDGDYTDTNLSFQPSAGYFISDNLVAGVSLSINSSKEDYGSFNFTSKQFLVGPFIRYYKFTTNERFAFTGEAGFGVGSNTNKSSNGVETKGSSLSIYLAPGFSYFLTERWGFDFQFRGITYSKTDPNKDTDNDEGTEFSFGLQSFSPSIGIRYYVNR
ncbi:MAG: porin family protein [Cyclobacteriaceae bacterium]|nr:porin family protein [Cyclobacteriaceae bacterium]